MCGYYHSIGDYSEHKSQYDIVEADEIWHDDSVEYIYKYLT